MAKGQVCWEPGQTGRADRSEMGGPVGPTGRADRSDGPVGSCPVPCISPTGASKLDHCACTSAGSAEDKRTGRADRSGIYREHCAEGLTQSNRSTAPVAHLQWQTEPEPTGRADRSGGPVGRTGRTASSERFWTAGFLDFGGSIY